MKQLHTPNESRAPRTTSSVSADPTRRPAITLQESPAASRRARWTGPLAIVLVLSILGFGGYAVDVPLSDLTANPITVGGDVRIVPLSGWRVTQPSAGGGISLTRGGGNLQITAGSLSSDPEELLTAYLRQAVQPQASHLEVSRTIEQVRLNSGLTGLRVGYLAASTSSAIQIEGEVTAVVSPSGKGAVFNAWAPRVLFPFERGDVDHMIATAEVT
jgi:hypothetical protein